MASSARTERERNVIARVALARAALDHHAKGLIGRRRAPLIRAEGQETGERCQHLRGLPVVDAVEDRRGGGTGPATQKERPARIAKRLADLLDKRVAALREDERPDLQTLAAQYYAQLQKLKPTLQTQDAFCCGFQVGEKGAAAKPEGGKGDDAADDKDDSSRKRKEPPKTEKSDGGGGDGGGAGAAHGARLARHADPPDDGLCRSA